MSRVKVLRSLFQGQFTRPGVFQLVRKDFLSSWLPPSTCTPPPMFGFSGTRPNLSSGICQIPERVQWSTKLWAQLPLLIKWNGQGGGCILNNVCYSTSFWNLSGLPASESLVQEPGDIKEAGWSQIQNKQMVFLHATQSRPVELLAKGCCSCKKIK